MVAGQVTVVQRFFYRYITVRSPYPSICYVHARDIHTSNVYTDHHILYPALNVNSTSNPDRDRDLCNHSTVAYPVRGNIKL
jgi:hypothetical protein